MPATVADLNRSLDSEQISPATIAHHTVYEKTPNLHQSHICQWGAQSYLVGPLSRLVGKPPLSPWVSADFLPLTQVVNNTNSTIPLTEIFDRVFSDVCNSLGFEVQKQKKRGSGNNRVYRNLKENLLHVVLPSSEGVKKDVKPRQYEPLCVCVFSSHSFWTSSSLDVPAGVTQEEGHTGFFIHLLSAVRALIFLARKIQPFLSLVDR